MAGVAGAASRLGCVVMAAGEGRRFGPVAGGKLLAPLGGVAVLERAVRSVPAEVYDIVVVSRWPAVRDLCRRLGVPCAPPEDGERSATVRSGIAWLGPRPGYLFLPGDQPLVRAASLRAMAAELAAEPRAIVRLAWDGRPASPVLWPGDCRAGLASLTGRSGGTSLLRRYPELAKRVRLVRATGPEEICDVDSPDDLERLERALAERKEMP